jgi:hypothetical protein
VRWDVAVVDDDIARAFLDEYYRLPETAAAGVEGLEDRLTGRGLQIITNPAGTVTEFRRGA